MKKIVLITMFLLQLIAYSQFSGGTGTPEDPYQIATAEDLDNIRNYLISSFIQTDDIDLGVAPWNEGQGWNPIGEYDGFDPSKSFRGNYDGNGYNIENLYIDNQDRSAIGLFGSTNGCILNNIHLDNISVKSIVFVGGLTGISYNDNILSSSVSGSIEGNDRVGLLAGFFEGYNIKNCNTEGSITTTSEAWFIGGGVGLCNSDSVYNCHSTITMTDSVNCGGGLIGWSIDSKLIEGCSSSISFTNTLDGICVIGGLVGYVRSTNFKPIISNSFSTGYISSNSDLIGGLIGGVDTVRDENNVTIRNSYSKVNVSGISEIGGFIGRNDRNIVIQNCYSTGQVAGNSDVGGFIGKIDSLNTVTVTNSYWDTETSGQLTTAGNLGEGRTTAEMTLPYSGSTYIDWDFTDVWADDIYFYNEGYPRLFWTTGIIDPDLSGIIDNYELFQNYPNPFNPVTQIKFALPEKCDIKLNVYNIKGQLISKLVNGTKEAGLHAVNFDATNFNSGLYFYTLEANGISITKKMILIK